MIYSRYLIKFYFFYAFILFFLLSGCGVPIRKTQDHRSLPSGNWPESEVRLRAQSEADPKEKIRRDRAYLVEYVEPHVSPWIGRMLNVPPQNPAVFYDMFRFLDNGRFIRVGIFKREEIEKINIDDISWGAVGYYFVDGDDLYIERLDIYGDRWEYIRHHGKIMKSGKIIITGWQIANKLSLFDEAFEPLSPDEGTIEASIIEGKVPQKITADW